MLVLLLGFTSRCSNSLFKRVRGILPNKFWIGSKQTNQSQNSKIAYKVKQMANKIFSCMFSFQQKITSFKGMRTEWRLKHLFVMLQTVKVQPNDGFGTILPHEKIDLYLYFSPDKAEVYINIVLVWCKSLENPNNVLYGFLWISYEAKTCAILMPFW